MLPHLKLQPCITIPNNVTVSLSRDSFNITTNYNPDGWGNKLVTIFARNRDNFILTLNLSLICQIRVFRLWTNPITVTNLSFAGIGKNCAMVACPPGLFLPKVPGHVTADGATNVYYRNRRAVMGNSADSVTVT